MGSRSIHEKKKLELKKGSWTREEDEKLLSYIQEHGHGSWRSLPDKAGLQRCGKSCRLRWTNYLRPDIKRGKFSAHEEKTIIRLHALLGNRWSSIAAYLPKRTDNEIKNYWNTRLKKRLTRMGIDPTTHKPRNSPSAPNLTHMAQWETARLEAEARLRVFKPLITTNTSNNINTTNGACYYNNAAISLVQSRPSLDVLKVWQGTSNSANHSIYSIRFVNSLSDGIELVDNNYAQTKGEIENSMHGHDCEHHNSAELLCNNGCDVACDGYDNSVMMMMTKADHDMRDYEETNSRCWNELLNMVISS